MNQQNQHPPEFVLPPWNSLQGSSIEISAMMTRYAWLLLAALVLSTMTRAYSLQNGTTKTSSRRALFFQSATTVSSVVFVVAASLPSPSHALDMDAFMQNELTKDSDKGQLSEDAALCKYGFPSRTTGEACVRAGMSTQRTAGVDAFGKADRGDFVRCKQFYADDGKGGYVKKTECDDGSSR